MNKTTVKLMTKGKFLMCTLAVAAGSGITLVREFKAKGAITNQSVIIAMISFCVGMAIISAVGWWANRPMPEDDNE